MLYDHSRVSRGTAFSDIGKDAMPPRPVSSSRELKRLLLTALGVSEQHVSDVELDLRDAIAQVRVTLIVPAAVNGLIETEVQRYELVSRSQAEEG